VGKIREFLLNHVAGLTVSVCPAFVGSGKETKYEHQRCYRYS
jgi:hypothetical protein